MNKGFLSIDPLFPYRDNDYKFLEPVKVGNHWVQVAGNEMVVPSHLQDDRVTIINIGEKDE